MFVLNIEATRNTAMVAGEARHGRSLRPADVHVTEANVVIVALMDDETGHAAWATMPNREIVGPYDIEGIVVTDLMAESA